MANHSSATVRRETPHENQTSRTNTIVNALKRRAEALINDSSIDAQSRAIIRYALEINDPWLARLVRGAEDDASEHNIEALAEIICRAGDEAAGALFVLMGKLQNCVHPEVLANTAKHFAFTRCGEMNLFGIVDSQIAVLESELLATFTS